MRAWVLKSRPNGMPQPSDFDLVETPDQPLQDGQIRVRNLWLSVDPYMRGRMNDAKSYVPPFQLGEPMQGGAVGEVVESRNPGFAPGDKVLHMAGWRDTATIGAEAMPQKLPSIGVSDDTWLHNLGLTGGTAYFGLLRTAEAKAGDVVFVSAAAGAVGSAVVQIAKLKGMTVIGSAGGADKVAFVKELGADACIDYKAGPVLPQLAKAAPDGIDVYFDNVGGEHLDAAFATARQWARFAICGMIDVYNDGKPQELKYIIRTIPTRLTMRGFIYTDYMADFPAFTQEMGGWVAGGKIKARTTVRDGLDATLDAFLGLFSGANTGKMLVRL
ncbi:NADP-dependent oxidoreductase [Sphingomonas tabacisoli]|uniref:NADP-dependent oxidoreductase n=1 Tax=Sphingomonas tabacisoli TaxID=2249466 RepID=A0ABW4I4J9_9SPHN